MKEIARLALSVLLILVESTTAQENAIGSTTSSQELINRSQSNLQQLHILFRHGDRAPVRRMFDNSTPIELLWPIGIGQLTNLGVKQEFNLGRWFREQYNSFVPEKYNASDIYVRSTDTDRSLMSGQAFLAGLYRCTDPKHCPLVPAGIFWRPVPIHTVPLTADVEFRSPNCPRLYNLTQERANSKEIETLLQNHQELINLLKRVSNYQKITADAILTITDILVCFKSNSIPLPSWCTDEIFRELRQIQYFVWKTEFLSSDEILQLEVGVFLKEMADGLVAATQRKAPFGETEVKRLMVYSVHDTNIDYVLASFGYTGGIMMDYASALIFEVLGPRPPSNVEKYHLRMRFKKGWRDDVANYIQILPCVTEPAEQGCQLDRVVQFLRAWSLTKEEYAMRCKLGSDSLRRSGVSLRVLLSTVMLLSHYYLSSF
ncbi:unnamed protein product [Calicophoron daubneyi]|uniref:acid phosphatase n=1 Tax=Calicophoron daubneyi TaxID=300641 RepID=A0AAV2T1U0_CALDB